MRKVAYSVEPDNRAAANIAIAVATVILSICLWGLWNYSQDGSTTKLDAPLAILISLTGFALLRSLFSRLLWKTPWVASITRVPFLGGHWAGEISRRDKNGVEDRFPVKVIVSQDFDSMSVEVIALSEPALGDAHSTQSQAVSMQVGTFPRVTVHDLFRYRSAEGVAHLTFESAQGSLLGDYFSSAGFSGRIVAKRAVQADSPIDLNSRRTTEAHKPTMDIAIVTIIEEEYDAVRRLLEDAVLVEGTADSPNLYAWRTGLVPQKSGKRPFRVVLAMVGEHATTPAAMATQATIDRFRPRYVVMCGIAGGLPHDACALGDVVTSTEIYAYQYGNSGQRFTPRHNFVYRCDRGLVSSAKAFSRDWMQRRADGTKVLFGAVASGDALVDDASSGFFADVLARWERLQAVEMEGAGAAGAIESAHARANSVGFIMVRGISDMPKTAPAPESDLRASQSGERKLWKSRACGAAASFCIEWIGHEWPIQPVSDERR